MDKEQKTSRLLNKATNFCEHCGQKLKAMYCVQCDIDCCVSCSSSLHQVSIMLSSIILAYLHVHSNIGVPFK